VRSLNNFFLDEMRGLFLGTLNLIVIVFGGKCDRCELRLGFCLVFACYSRTA
jgi:hypothetical protein